MELFEQIRLDRREEQLSIRELADRQHVHRRTVRRPWRARSPPRKSFPPWRRPAIDSNRDTYLLNGISCSSAISCVAGGGVNGGPGPAAVISTTDGGATWSMSADPALAGVQQVMSLSCLATSGSPVCRAAVARG